MHAVERWNTQRKRHKAFGRGNTVAFWLYLSLAQYTDAARHSDSLKNRRTNGWWEGMTFSTMRTEREFDRYRSTETPFDELRCMSIVSCCAINFNLSRCAVPSERAHRLSISQKCLPLMLDSNWRYQELRRSTSPHSDSPSFFCEAFHRWASVVKSNAFSSQCTCTDADGSIVIHLPIAIRSEGNDLKIIIICGLRWRARAWTRLITIKCN